MTLEDLRFTHSLIRKKPIGCFGVRPVLTGQRDAIANPLGNLLYELSEPLLQTHTTKLTARALLINPGLIDMFFRFLLGSHPKLDAQLYLQSTVIFAAARKFSAKLVGN